ncbi:unnamed protein product [Caenorhabditis auriculariae]|uniref:M23ase beta-sheet core domain-containing protein n=1 Tax=Caenorhabditis auriculariae TaxID=2777116 RepID=A0A8S1HKU0_9PELO|nr:unnamed protein product [Caenorhabditis auriculariae]
MSAPTHTWQLHETQQQQPEPLVDSCCHCAEPKGTLVRISIGGGQVSRPNRFIIRFAMMRVVVLLHVLLSLPQGIESLGCMVKVCGNNAENEFRRCPDIDGSCGNYHTERSNGEIVDGVDVRCHPGEPIYAPFEGEMYFWRPFSGKKDKSCADQGVRIEGTGQWQGYAVHISSVKLSFFGGHVQAGDEIGEAIDRSCFLGQNQKDVEDHVQIKLFRGGVQVDPTHHLQNCMCTGQICESNSRNQLFGEPFKADKRYNGVRGWDLLCPIINDDDEDPRVPVIYSPISGEIMGRVRLFSDHNGAYSGCDNEGMFIVGTEQWIGFEARIYNVRTRSDIGFGRKRIVQGEPIGARLDCDNSPDSIFLELRYQGRVVNVTDIITAENCKLPELPNIMSSREGGVKQLSSSLLDMKFMLRTKKKIEEKERKKKENALKNAIQPAEVASSSSDCKDDSKYETTKNLAMLEGLTYGRMSFKGFNKEVEQLMEYYERIRNGEISDDEEEEKGHQRSGHGPNVGECRSKQKVRVKT